jgi:hypothetical protein
MFYWGCLFLLCLRDSVASCVYLLQIVLPDCGAEKGKRDQLLISLFLPRFLQSLILL